MAKILLVEDDDILREMYHDVFTHNNWEVQTANDGKDALTKLQSFTPDAILLDLIMPNMTGFEFLKERTKNDPMKQIPVVVLTNIYPDSEDLVKNWGVNEVILKANSTPYQVLSRIQAFLTQKSS